MKTADYIRKNALIYERYKDNFEEIDSWEIMEFRREVAKAFYKIPLHEIDVHFVGYDPYENLEELTRSIKTNKVLLISSLNNDSQLLQGDLNLQFRAVHDYLHYLLQAPFTAEGEIKVYHMQKKFHGSEVCRQILFSEVVLQACYAEYFGRFAPVQKVVLYNGKI